jgi:putative transposase
MVVYWGTARRAPTTPERFASPIAGSLPTIVRAYKSAVTKRINLLRSTPGKSVFQRNYYEHIIGSDREYERIADYIDANPLNWLRDEEREG